MDEQSENIQHLGAFRIVGEAFRILRCCPKLFGAITITLVLPLSFASLLHTLISLPLSVIILSDELNFLTGDGDYDTSVVRESHRQLIVFLMLETAYAVFFYALSMLLAAAVAYTVACIYSGKQEPCFATVMKVLPRLWKRMVITFLCILVLVVVNAVAFAFAVSLLIWGFNHFNISSAGPFNAALIVTCVVFVRVWVHIVILWRLACVVSALEEEYYGLEGVKNSHCLIYGKDTTALVLTLLYLMIKGGFSYAVVSGDWDVFAMEEGGLYGIVLVLMECAVTLMGPLTQSVLYFVCKSYHEESIDEWWVLDQMESYHGEYLPVKSCIYSPNNQVYKNIISTSV